MASHLLEQIAEEMGNVFTNKRQTEMTGADGGPMEFSVPALDHLTPGELDTMERFNRAQMARD
jgi:hypothetical protein